VILISLLIVGAALAALFRSSAHSVSTSITTQLAARVDATQHYDHSRGPPWTTVDPTAWLQECVPSFKRDNFGGYPLHSLYGEGGYSNYWLIAEPSGLCAPELACAFEGCAIGGVSMISVLNSSSAATTYEDVKQHLPQLNLASKIAFPKSVAEMVAVVKHADVTGHTISIKTSGHSYTGSSTFKDSVQLNLRSFPKYSETSVRICEDEEGPCKLALARGKTAVVRVGGGELWDDAYRAVINFNTRVGTYKNVAYEIIGGGAGTVSSIGGWLQGGGLSTGLSRLYGFGVDQVLEIEMVLADGEHVKFGPTEWETDSCKECLYPQTTKVEGLCNANIDSNEANWEWRPCSKDIDFAGLWFAVRGGGGGTYGIVAALHYQIHEILEHMTAIGSIQDPSAAALLRQMVMGWQFDNAKMVTMQNVFADFLVDFLFNPASVGVSEYESMACGSAAFNGKLLDNLQGNGLWCKQSAGKAYIRAWSELDFEQLAGLTPSEASITRNMWGFASNFSNFPEWIIQGYGVATGSSPLRIPIGHVADNPKPMVTSQSIFQWTATIPREWLLTKDEHVHMYMSQLGGAHLIGGKANVSSDGQTSNSLSIRNAGIEDQLFDIPQTKWVHTTIFRNAMRPYQHQVQEGYPPDTEYNHMSPNANGPRKSDYNSPCAWGLTKEEQKKTCVNILETVWGKAGLSKLEQIKQRVDPKTRFKCFRCVGGPWEFGSFVPDEWRAALNLSASDVPKSALES